MKNEKPLLINMKPRNTIKMDFVVLDKSEVYPEEKVLLENRLYRYLYLYQVIMFCTTCKIIKYLLKFALLDVFSISETWEFIPKDIEVFVRKKDQTCFKRGHV